MVFFSAGAKSLAEYRCQRILAILSARIDVQNILRAGRCGSALFCPFPDTFRGQLFWGEAFGHITIELVSNDKQYK